MARRIRWSDLAYREFEEATEYISRNSVTNAASFAARVIEKVESLLISAEHHGVVPEWNEETLRETLVDRYRLIYQVTQFEIRIVGLIHGSRDLLSHWIAAQRGLE